MMNFKIQRLFEKKIFLKKINKIALVTGCAGFIGYHLSKKLLEKNISVVGIDNINSYIFYSSSHRCRQNLAQRSLIKLLRYMRSIFLIITLIIILLLGGCVDIKDESPEFRKVVLSLSHNDSSRRNFKIPNKHFKKLGRKFLKFHRKEN